MKHTPGPWEMLGAWAILVIGVWVILGLFVYGGFRIVLAVRQFVMGG
jgi:hypothetical protein